MRVLVLGSGGREHALCWAIARSPLLTRLYCAPGNAGIDALAERVELDIEDPGAVVAVCQAQRIDLLVIGPEAPLAAGVSDAARAAGLRVFGPSAAAAQLEISKAFTKEICAAASVPTASYAQFTDRDAAKAYLRKQGAPIVIKADGLAAGKGVVVAEDVDTALAAVDSLFDGPGGGELLIEECLRGPEASYFVLGDGNSVVPLAGAQDHKRAFDGDKGPNTGGMGAYSPAPDFTPAIEQEAFERIAAPIFTEMAQRGTPYCGVMYLGLMLTGDGPKLIEINARFGDPECQCILPRVNEDVLALLRDCADGMLGKREIALSREACLTVVMATQGYPGSCPRGSAIGGLERAEAVPGLTLFHAGTALRDGRIVANGGRVLNVTATGADIRESRDRAYSAIAQIDWPEGFCRSDIGWRALRG